MAALRSEPRCTFVEDLAHPEKRLEVMLECRPPEQSDLSDIRRAQARHAALALDRFDHRRLFAADIGARAPAKMDLRQRPRSELLQCRDFALERVPAGVILVSQIDPDPVDADGPGCDEHALEKPRRG